MLDIINLSFPIRCRAPSIFAKAMLSNEEKRLNTAYRWPWGKTQAMLEILQQVCPFKEEAQTAVFKDPVRTAL